VQNAFAESFIGRLRDELLNETLFRPLPHARAVLEAWRADYNTERPHSRLGWMTPASYTEARPTRASPTTRLQFRLDKKRGQRHSLAVLEWRVKWTNRRIAMSKAQKGNKEKKKPKVDKNQPKTHVSAYKAAQGQGKPSFNPFARKTWG
jgi:hypothetical protein